MVFGILAMIFQRVMVCSTLLHQLPNTCMAKEEKLCDNCSCNFPISQLYKFKESAGPNEVISISRIGFVGGPSFTGRIMVYESGLHQHSECMLDLFEWKAAFLSQLRADKSTLRY